MGSGHGVAEVLRDLSEGESVVVWGERYESRDLLDFELEISETTAGELRRAAESEALLWRAGLCVGEASFRSLSGAASACCAGRVLRALGLWDRERGASALTCADWLELACSRGILREASEVSSRSARSCSGR